MERQARPDCAGPPQAGTAHPGTATGDPRVDAALAVLDRLAELPVHRHPDVFERVHGHLAEVLGELDAPADQGSAG